VSDFLERIANLSPKRLALLASELNAKLEALNQKVFEPVAVIGIGCRFPGGADDPNSFWRLMIEGRDAISEVPPERWDIDALYDPDPDAPGKMSTRWGGFLERIEQFDPEFFGISPREAAGMDPQQRLLLEVVWEALENAGQNPDRLAGSPTSVFVGVCNSDYFLKRFESARGSVDAYVATGNAHSVASGRISYILGLKGPSISVDTACSASLTAVHLACQSLKVGESRMAIAGGVNLILMPDTTMILSKSHMMAPDGRCKPFDAAADGFVRSEGCGIVLLKRLSDARADGDTVLALIRGTASNQDGHSSGLTAPNGPSQVAVIRKALANAGLQPGDVDFIEAHGTGTSLGDPIEARALAEIFGPGRSSEHSLRIGSVKGNLGHAESAAGIAGLIKTILALQHGKIPPTLHLKNLSPHVEWDGLAISVPTVTTGWNRENGRRVAGVSSFGFSGTNAHVILSDALPAAQVSDLPSPGTRKSIAPPLQLLTLSAQSEPALAELAQKYEQFLNEKPGLNLRDVCYSANTGRAHFEHRLTALAADLPETRERLEQFLRGEKHHRIRSRRAISSASPKVVLMFTGQGSQYVGMGRELFETQSIFQRELERCAEILRPVLDRPLLELIFGGKEVNHSPHLLDETQYAQPALFALEYALATMWRSWGVEPAAVLGHSVGEYVAACLAGVFSLEDGLRLITERGRLMATLPRGGAMAAVFADEARVSKAIAGTGTAIACLNGPSNTVISGEGVELSAVLEGLAAEGIRSRRLVVSHAFHSSLMDPILDSFQRAAEDIRYSEPQIAIISNVTGRIAEPGLVSRSEYWSGHIRKPVRFADSIRGLCESGRSLFLEIGPHPVLTGMAGLSVPEVEVVSAASLHRDTGNWESLLESVSTLYLHGVNIEWTGLHAMHQRKRIVLPNYPFQRGRYWLQQRETRQTTLAFSSVEEELRAHPFSGTGLNSPTLSERATGASITHAIEAEPESWFYEIAWREQETSLPTEREDGKEETDLLPQTTLPGQKPLAADEILPTAVAPGFWVVLGDTKGIAEEVAFLILDRGDQCVLVSQASEYKLTDDCRAALDPERAEDFARLFSHAFTGRQGPLKGILNLWSVDEEISAETTPSQWDAAQARLGGGVIHATQSFLLLPSASVAPEARLWFATRGAQTLSEGNLGAGSSQPAQALVWGLARVISLEHPGRFGAVIDLQFAASPKEAAAAIWSEIESRAGEEAVAYRDGRRLLPRVVRTGEPPSEPLNLRGDGSYLITGGLGGLGLQVANWMAQRGAGHIVLLTRRDFPDRLRWEQLNLEDKDYGTVRKILEAEKLGTRITVAQGDVADEIAMQSLFKRFGKEEPPLRGIIHAAVEMTSRSIKDLDLASFQKMCRAKALGGWILNQLTLDQELDFFVLFSSTTAVWGVAGLGHYAAANQALDLLAHWRRERGLPALSVNWGTWHEMRIAGEAEKEQFVKSGLHPMPDAQALVALEHLISANRTSAVVASIEWNTLRAVYEARRTRPLFAEMRSRPRNEKAAIVSMESAAADSEINRQLKNASPTRRRDILIAHLRSQTSSILGFDFSREVELEQGLFDMGMDSLMAVELKGRLERSLNVPLPSTLTFNYPTIQALTNYLLSEVLQFDTAPSSEQIAPIPPAAPVKVESVLQPSEALSEDEVSILLLQRLERMQ
jgi:acyl transferase domain-containing protein/acyl carrier protein